uniref:Putative secreted protein n=1 Tax=Anopheles darlingi TaxID=43151 RepID=A0A2M4D8U8_ANODA
MSRQFHQAVYNWFVPLLSLLWSSNAFAIVPPRHRFILDAWRSIPPELESLPSSGYLMLLLLLGSAV